MANLSLERLLFDPAAPTDGPLVGSYLLGASGTVLTDTAGALDVNITNASVVVTATDLDIRDLVYTQDSVAVKGPVGGFALEPNADGSLNFVFESAVADGSPDTENPIKTGAHAYNQASALGAVTAGSKVNTAADLYRRQFINDAPNIASKTTAVVVGVVAAAMIASPLAGRTRIMIQNKAANPIFVGDATVTISTGIEISKGGTLSLELGQAVPLFAISGSAAQGANVLELA